MLREQLGLSPVEAKTNIYTPAPTVTALMRKSGTGYKERTYEAPYAGSKKILVVCTEQDLLETRNGKLFLTGNHPVEMYVPMLHLEHAGFSFDIATPTGSPVKIEEWALPVDDEHFDDIYARTREQRLEPMRLPDAIEKMNAGGYIALFIPGGHGAILGLPEDHHVKAALKYFQARKQHILSLCHGPAAFLAAAEGAGDPDYLFKGYTIAAFPDFMDRQLPKVGYLPGDMPWLFGERLEALGVDIVTSLGNGRTHVDRNLITGDGPLAANELGRLAADALLKATRN